MSTENFDVLEVSVTELMVGDIITDYCEYGHWVSYRDRPKTVTKLENGYVTGASPKGYCFDIVSLGSKNIQRIKRPRTEPSCVRVRCACGKMVPEALAGAHVH